MFNALPMYRLAIVWAVSLGLAIFFGYMVADPFNSTTILALGGFLLFISFPILMRWHHLFVVACWNIAITMFFLPGQPPLSSVMILACGLMALMQGFLTKDRHMLSVPSLTRPLIVLAVIIVITMRFTGGFGGLGGGGHGSKRYLSLATAILGYFALTSQAIPRKRAVLYGGLFFLSGLTSAIGDLAQVVGIDFPLFYAFFPSNIAFLQSITVGEFSRFTGLTFAAVALSNFLLFRFGIKGIFNWNHPFRLLFFVSIQILSLLGGFRSIFLLLLTVFVFLFYLEGLLRSRLFLAFVIGGLLIGITFVIFIEKMPLPVQRSLSFLPVHVDPRAAQDASSTLDWRVQLWKLVWPEVPQHLILGKGLSYSESEFVLNEEAFQRGLSSVEEATLITRSYHSGFLSLIVAFGAFGFIAFVAFCLAGLRALFLNYRFGEPGLQTANTFLLALFLARFVSYFAVYGQFEWDLGAFTGMVGLGIALNGGVAAARPRVRGIVSALPPRFKKVSPVTAVSTR